MNRHLTIIVRRRWVVLGLTVLVAAMIAVPATIVWASHNYGDVSTSNPHHNNIGLITSAGVTSGCQASPPEYCPNDAVTRAQMATFMARLGGLGNHPPVVDADTLDGNDGQNYVFGPDPDTTLVDQSQTFTLTGGQPSECVQTQAFNGETDFRIIHQAHETPAGVEPWEVNVQIDDVNPPLYDVCFATLDGSNLASGSYSTYGMMLIYP
ncbi:MAG: hypothetical protein WD638_10050 [Nitriliruptoraceae bacterium]